MTDPLQAAQSSQQLPKQDPEALVLRGRPRPAVRFRRGLIVGLTGAVAAVLVTLSWFALEPARLPDPVSAAGSDEPARNSLGDSLAGAPDSYGDVPRLGPPLPGDLGRPILEHQRGLGEPPTESLGATASGSELMQADQDRRASAKLAARASPVIVELAAGGRAAASDAAANTNRGPAEAADRQEAAGAGEMPASQQQKLNFAGAATGGDLNPNELHSAPSPWTVSAGTVIPASLITGLNSDLPGIVLAQVTENVRDSATGQITLIPQGARLVGSYDSLVAYGQRRALLVWTRIVFPDGSSVQLDKVPASDASGYIGLEDKVDGHGWQLLKGIALSTLFGVGTELSLGSGEGGLVRAIRESGQQNAAHAGDQITSRNLDIQPTIKVRPGWPVRAIVNQDLVLQPWRK